MDDTLRIGALIDAAERHQQLAQEVLSGLAAHANGLDAVLREGLREALVAEFQALGEAGHAAAEALQGVRRAASVRLAAWTIAVSLISAAAPLAVCRTLLPSPEEVERLRSEYVGLSAAVSRLRDLGGGVDLRRCGQPARLCVRVDRRAPAFEDGEFLVVKGY